MKSFFSHLAGIKTAACLCYTASMLAYGAVCLAMGLETVEVMMVFQLGLVCLLCGAIQYILFSGAVVRAMPYGRRVALALPAFLAVAAGAGVLFSWFPAADWRGWAIFLAVFLAAFAAILAGFEIYARITGQRYDALLARYKEEHGEK